MIRNAVWMAAAAVMASTAQASASVVISSAQTENMTCSAGVCAPTADDAVLNVSDLETLLDSGNVVVTTYARHVRAQDIMIEVALSSSSSYTLTLQAGSQVSVEKSTSMLGAGGLVLDAKHVSTEAPVSISGSGGIEIYGGNVHIDGSLSILGTSGLSVDATHMTVERPVSIQGSGAVVISGQLYFESKGGMTFANLSTSVNINGKQYALVDSLPALAAAIAANPQGSFALANPYNASGDGIYSASPIPTNFLGSLEGFGNAISNITVNNTNACCVGGLFQSISEASVANVRLTNVNVTSVQGAAGLAYESFGTITASAVTGSVVRGGSGDIAGLVGDNYGTIDYSYSAAAVSAGATVTGINVGGLIGADYGTTDYSFASGAVSVGNGSGNIGGLIGEHNGYESPQDCYATGSVSGGTDLNIGGLIGINDYDNVYPSAEYCYSTGVVFGGDGSTVGGLIGVNDAFVSDDYWDTTTSGTDVGVGLGNASGVTGLTTTQLQSGLPGGFPPNIWHQNSKINNGLPYLIKNPPPK